MNIQAAMKKLLCKLLGHKAGYWQAAVGGRNVKRCQRCDAITEEQSVVKDARLPPMPRPKGHQYDSWLK